MSDPDLLFTVRNNYYLGAFQAAIAEAADIEGLSDSEKTERDCFVYRAYIELGSYEVKQSPGAELDNDRSVLTHEPHCSWRSWSSMRLHSHHQWRCKLSSFMLNMRERRLRRYKHMPLVLIKS